MTLVHNPHGPGRAGTERSGSDLGGPRSFPMDNDNAASPRLREPSLVFARSDHVASPRRDFGAAMELIDKAVQVIDALQARCRQLELESK